jgi:hypothetical protein
MFLFFKKQKFLYIDFSIETLKSLCLKSPAYPSCLKPILLAKFENKK